MQTEFIAVPPFWTVGQTIDLCARPRRSRKPFYEIFVVDPAYRLIGTVPLDKLLRSKRPVKIEEIMSDDPDVVRATDDQEDVARSSSATTSSRWR
jgi:magnesium transporter